MFKKLVLEYNKQTIYLTIKLYYSLGKYNETLLPQNGITLEEYGIL